MRTFMVFAHGVELPEAVKVGFSWPAFFFSFLWMADKGLWKLAVLWFGIYTAVAVMALVSSSPDPLRTVAFAVIIDLALAALAGANGNRWWEHELLDRRYKHVATVSAKNPEAAIEQA